MNNILSSNIKPLEAIDSALELINDLSKHYSKESLEATRGFIYSIEGIIPFKTYSELYELIANIELLHEK